jgi:two-component system, chemotaxis family, chemotaxis protein CheY
LSDGAPRSPGWKVQPAMARVLVIDDEEDMRRVVDVMLKTAGHDTVLAVDGHDGLQKFEQQRFDLVICDLFMPNKEGIATLRELRRLNPTVPVIMMSSGMPSTSYLGIAHVDYLAMAKAFGATRTIEKPFKYSQLIKLVRECLGQ